MWFLYFCITSIIVIFSGSQLFSSINTLSKFESIPSSIKQKLSISIVLHSIINIVWLIVIFSVSSINQHYIALIVAYVISIPTAIYMASKVNINDLKNLETPNKNSNNTNKTKSIKKLEEYSKKYDSDNSSNNTLLFDTKIKNLEKTFDADFYNISDYYMCHIGNKKCDVFLFDPQNIYGSQPIFIVQLLTKKRRYFVVELEMNSYKIPELYEYTFTNKKENKNNLGPINIFKDDLGYYVILEKIEEILETESKEQNLNNEPQVCPKCSHKMINGENFCRNCGYFDGPINKLLNELEELHKNSKN